MKLLRKSVVWKAAISIIALTLVIEYTWMPIRIYYYSCKLVARDPASRVAGVSGLISLGTTGKETLEQQFGSEEEARFLVQVWQGSFAKFDERDGESDSGSDAIANAPFVVASRNNYERSVKLLADKQEVLGITSQEEYNWALLEAIRGKKKSLVDYLLEKGAESNFTPRGARGSPLHYAVESNSIDIVKLLVEGGANVNSMGPVEATVLHSAVRVCSGLIVTYLIENGANASLEDTHGYMPIHYAALSGNKEAANVLLEAGALQDQYVEVNMSLIGLDDNDYISCEDRWLLIHFAAYGGNRAVIELLVKNDLDCRSLTEHFGYSPLHIAVFRGSREAVEILLEYGLNPDLLTKEQGGLTPLHFAAVSGNVKVGSLLISYGATVDSKSWYSETPSFLAVRHANLKFLEFLYDEGSDIKTVNERGENLLHVGAESGASDIVIYLLEKTLDIDAQDGFGNTPLHQASAYGRFEMTKLLLQNGANPILRNDEDQQPIDCAENEKVRLLLKEWK